MTATDRLDAIEARANAATEGPWARFSTHLGAVQMVCPDTDWYERQHVNDVVIATLSSEPTAEFIAHARTDVPALVAALRAVLDLHQPKADGPMSLVYWEFCSCGTLEVHEDEDGYQSIGPAKYPCPTVRAIEEALT